MIKSFGLLILRLSIGTMLIHHGYEKTADIENFADAFVKPLHLPFPIFLSYIAAYSEIYGSWLLIVGLFTRLGALSIVGTISVAIYHAVVTAGFNIYLLELLILYFGVAVFFVWVVRYENIKKEFVHYNLPRWLRDLVGILKLSFGAMLQFSNTGIVQLGALGITILMSAAVITHIRLKSRFREYIASVAMLAISLIILANNS